LALTCGLGLSSLALGLSAPPPAEACGCFAPPDPSVPIVQAGERILFAHKDGVVTAHIQIQYQGKPGDFGWLLPLPAVPTDRSGKDGIELGVDELFTQLISTTQPKYRMNRVYEQCGSGLSRNAAFGASEAAGSAADGIGGDMGAPPQAPTPLVIKDSIADITLQQVLTRPEDFDVIATLNLNGDYLSDALAAQVGGIGIAPGANLSDSVACFEATHGTAPKYAGKDYVNPGSEILSAEMMLRHMGWKEAADLIISSMEKSIKSKKVTYDFARLMDGATQVSCSGFGQVMIDNM